MSYTPKYNFPVFLFRQYCDPWNVTNLFCIHELREQYTRGGWKCDCPHACQSKHFIKSTSSVSWPSEAFTPHFAARMLQSNSPSVRKFVNTLLSDETTSPQPALAYKMRENFARIHVTFETTAYTRITESPKYTYSILFGTVGGNLGLWIGWSILSFLEFFQWIISLNVLLVVRLKSRWQSKLQPRETHKVQNNPYL